MQLIGCDFAVAAENSTFVCLSEVNWGILPGALVAKCIADSLLPRHAMYYASVGEPFDGKEAERIGLINFAVPQDQVRAKTIELAGKLMSKSPKVLRATKQAVRNVRTMDVTQSYDYLAEKGKAIKVGDRRRLRTTPGCASSSTRRATSRPTSRSSSERCSSRKGLAAVEGAPDRCGEAPCLAGRSQRDLTAERGQVGSEPDRRARRGGEPVEFGERRRAVPGSGLQPVGGERLSDAAVVRGEIRIEVGAEELAQFGIDGGWPRGSWLAIPLCIDLGWPGIGVGCQDTVALRERAVFDEDDGGRAAGDQGRAAGIEVGAGGGRADGRPGIDPCERGFQPLGVGQKRPRSRADWRGLRSSGRWPAVRWRFIRIAAGGANLRLRLEAPNVGGRGRCRRVPVRLCVWPCSCGSADSIAREVLARVGQRAPSTRADLMEPGRDARCRCGLVFSATDGPPAEWRTIAGAGVSTAGVRRFAARQPRRRSSVPGSWPNGATGLVRVGEAAPAYSRPVGSRRRLHRLRPFTTRSDGGKGHNVIQMAYHARIWSRPVRVTDRTS